MHRHTKIPLVPVQAVEPVAALKNEQSQVVCKSNFLNFILEMLRLDRVYKFLSRIGLTRLSAFVYHAMLMFITVVYISISCVLYILCMHNPLEDKRKEHRKSSSY
ncbi:hypothetical protein CCA_00711 [Chlamydia caviae GPIC]|uniref:Uncharacterized protein n=1 Tax=Chlamydia caviae (strain ATCC VR-813 / DSM 19441 / 03DC25 / GPIC) TaxID=227941 RepID=Q822H1_CHLCV|nr:hypothetical protein CCA_00711 [Chlamydia caviae GPIC]